MSPTRVRSDRLRASTGMIAWGAPTTPSRYVAGGGRVGSGVGSGTAAGAGAGRAMTPPRTTSDRTRTTTTALSRRVIDMFDVRRREEAAPALSGWATRSAVR